MMPFDIEVGTPFLRVGGQGYAGDADEKPPNSLRPVLCWVLTPANHRHTVRVMASSGDFAGVQWFARIPSYREVARGYARCVELAVSARTREAHLVRAMHCAMLAAEELAHEPLCRCGRKEFAEGCVGCALAAIIEAHRDQVRKDLDEVMREIHADYRQGLQKLDDALRLALDWKAKPLAVVRKLLEVEDMEYELFGDTPATAPLLRRAGEALGLDEEDVFELRGDFFDQKEKKSE